MINLHDGGADGVVQDDVVHEAQVLLLSHVGAVRIAAGAVSINFSQPPKAG